MNKISAFVGTDDYDPSGLGHEDLNRIEKLFTQQIFLESVTC